MTEPGHTIDAETPPVGKTMNRRAEFLSIAALAMIAAALRLHRVGADDLWFDEILSVRRATAPLGEAHSLIREGTHPPLYSQGVLRPWLTLGESELLVRLPSVVFGVVTVGLTWLLARRIAGPRAALAAAALLTVLPLHVYYSREGRMYALLAMLLTGWLLALSTAQRQDTGWAWGTYTVLGAAALYTHYYAGFTLLSTIGVSAVFFLRSCAERRRHWLIATSGIAVAFVPWLPTFGFQLANDPVSHLRALSLSETVGVPIRFFTAYAGSSTTEVILIGGSLAVLAGAAVLALVNAEHLTPDRRFDAFAVAGALVGTMALAVVASRFRPLIFVRYFTGVLPMLCVVAGVAWSFRPRHALTLPAAIVLMAICIIHVPPTLTTTWRPAFGAATDVIEAGGTDGTVVFLAGHDHTNFNVVGFWHYLDPEIGVVTVDVGRDSLADALAAVEPDVQRVWVVQYRPIDTFEAPDGFIITNRTRFDSRFPDFDISYPVVLSRLDASR